MGCVELGISVAVKFHEEMLSGNGKFVFIASLIWFVMEVLLMVFVRMGWWRRRKSFFWK